jgi:hypothetical protein
MLDRGFAISPLNFEARFAPSARSTFHGWLRLSCDLSHTNDGDSCSLPGGQDKIIGASVPRLTPALPDIMNALFRLFSQWMVDR